MTSNVPYVANPDVARAPPIIIARRRRAGLLSLRRPKGDANNNFAPQARRKNGLVPEAREGGHRVIPTAVRQIIVILTLRLKQLSFAPSEPMTLGQQ